MRGAGSASVVGEAHRPSCRTAAGRGRARRARRPSGSRNRTSGRAFPRRRARARRRGSGGLRRRCCRSRRSSPCGSDRCRRAGRQSPAMAFSTIGSSTRRRTRRPASMTMWASASAVAAPAMSFFISSMPLSGLMSSPPVSKQTPLPTSVTFGAAAAPQVKSTRRGASAAALPTAWISGKVRAPAVLAAHDPRLGAVALGERERRRFERRRSDVVGGRVDEVAGRTRCRGHAVEARAHRRPRARRDAAPRPARSCSGVKR